MCEGGVLGWDEAGLEERTFSKTKKFNKCNELSGSCATELRPEHTSLVSGSNGLLKGA